MGNRKKRSDTATYENKDYEYEIGTQNMPGITGLLAGAEFIEQTGLAAIMEKEARLMEMLYCGLEQIEGVRIYGNHDVCRRPVMSLNFQGLKASDAAYILESGYGIIVRSGPSLFAIDP